MWYVPGDSGHVSITGEVTLLRALVPQKRARRGESLTPSIVTRIGPAKFCEPSRSSAAGLKARPHTNGDAAGMSECVRHSRCRVTLLRDKS